jgi:CDP-diacylglycerol--serine O-phosphatidyltransferase
MERRMNWRKLMFVLPNLFTVSSIFCGFYAITLSSGAATPRELYTAALAIFFAMFFDGFDGRVARLTRTQSEFGVELDSLADVISFGVAPALLVYKWGLHSLGFAGIVLAFAFATCGALRLARFNVMAHRHVPGSSKFFTGLPIPLAAGMIVAMVIAHYNATSSSLEPGTHAPLLVALIVLILAALMVSNVRYRTFKDVRLSKKSATVFFVVVLAGVAAGMKLPPAYVMVAYFSAYLLLGLAEGAVGLARRRPVPLAVSAQPSDDARAGKLWLKLLRGELGVVR